MTDKQFHVLFGEALASADRDAFVSEWALASIWDDAPDSEISADRLIQLGSIWDASHRSVRDIAAAAELSQRQLAERFCVPYRTMEDWCRGLRTPPDYVRLMMQECLGLIHRL
mgnify:CR=1 FL=1